jgi:predicted HTH transcriptional regulator
MESFGTGLHRIQTLCDEAKIRVEIATEPWGFTVIFYRPDWGKEFSEKNKTGMTSSRQAQHAYTSKHTTAILDLLEKAEKVSSSELEVHLELSRAQVNKILKAMLEEGSIERAGAGPSTHYILVQ